MSPEELAEQQRLEAEAAAALEQQTQQSQQTNVQVPPTNDQTELLRLALRESEQARIRQEQQLAEFQAMRNQQAAPTAFDYSTLNEDFVNRPAEVTAQITRELIRQENEKNAAALAEIRREQKQQASISQYQILRNQFAGMNYWDQVASTVDAAMATMDVTPQNMMNAYNWALGQLLASGKLNLQTSPSPKTPVQPGQLAPSTPPLPTGNARPVQRQVTELQRRIMRENNMTEDQYFMWLNADSKSITTMSLEQK